MKLFLTDELFLSEVVFESKCFFLRSSWSDFEYFSKKELFLRSSWNDFELFSRKKLFLRSSLSVRSCF